MSLKTIDSLIAIIKIAVGMFCFAPGLFGISTVVLQLLSIVRFLCSIHTAVMYIVDILAQKDISDLTGIVRAVFFLLALKNIAQFLL